MSLWLRVCAAVAVFLAGACSTSPPAAPEPAAYTPAAAPPVSGTGSIQGQVVFQGSNLPRSTRVKNTTDPHQCGSVQSLRNCIISTENRGIKNVIVALAGVLLPEDYRPEPAELVIDNRDCQFQPHVAVVTSGSHVQASNSDPITHSVHVYGFLNKNLALGPNQSKFAWTFRRPGYYIVKCDLHGWMQAFFRVDNHPFHAVSDGDGVFQIVNVPPGIYTLEAWHEYFGEKETEVEVKADMLSRVTLGYGDKTPG